VVAPKDVNLEFPDEPESEPKPQQIKTAKSLMLSGISQVDEAAESSTIPLPVKRTSTAMEKKPMSLMRRNTITRKKVESKQKETHDLIETIFEGSNADEKPMIDH